MSLLRRRIMIDSAKKKEPNGFKPGEYVNDAGNLNTVNADGSITSTSMLCRFVAIPIKEPIHYNSGDIITFAQDRNYDSLQTYRYVHINNSSGLCIVENKVLNNYAESSVTAPAAGTINAIYFGNCSILDFLY